MTIENQLRELILLNYGSLREFTFNIGLPYSTLSTILKNGIMTANISNVVKICDALNIKINELVEGRLVENIPGEKLLDVEKIKAPGVKIKGQILDENTEKLLISSVDLIYQLALKMYQK